MYFKLENMWYFFALSHQKHFSNLTCLCPKNIADKDSQNQKKKKSWPTMPIETKKLYFHQTLKLTTADMS